MRAKTSGSNKKYFLPKDLARYARCSARTIREYCEKGKIPEAIRTSGGHWRIRRPLSEKTKWFLAKIRREWPFDGSSEVEGEVDLDFAEALATAKMLNCDAEDLLTDPEAEQRHPEKQTEIAEVKKSFYERLKPGEAFPRLPIVWAVNRFWWKHHRTPTIGELVKEMQLSRSTFYRRRYNRIFKDVVYAVSGKVKDNSWASQSDGIEKPDFGST